MFPVFPAPQSSLLRTLQSRLCRRYTAIGASFVLACLPLTAQQPGNFDDQVHMNEIQVIGSHNSYHAGLTPGMTKLLESKSPKVVEGLDYQHADLATQFSGGIRQIELDIFADSKGGLYAHPKGPQWVANAGLPADPDPYPDGRMMKPGFKVMHVQDIDYVSTCQPLIACLQTVRTWSQAHPEHLPLFILIETKQGTPKSSLPFTTPEQFTSATFDALDQEIRSVFSADEMITPDQVRGSFATLNEAIRKQGWPTLAQARGKVVFLMDQRPVGPVYLDGHPSLRGRVIFTNAVPGQPDAAFTEENDGSPEEIAALVREGYLVRTRSDSDTKEARINDTVPRRHALASGAQIISTDYPPSEPAKWTGYKVSFPDGLMARCNPVLPTSTCISSELETK